MSIHYVVACWSGLRRVNPKATLADRSVFLRAQINSLTHLRHSIDQVTFVVSHNPDEPREFRECLEKMPPKLGTADVKILERRNVGYSYGAYSDAVQKYPGFDQVLLMEDDYIFLMPEFDLAMKAILDEEHRNGFVSFVVEGGSREWLLARARKEAPGGEAFAEGLKKYMGERFHYARVSVGMASRDALEGVVRVFGRLPHSSGANHTECKFEGQFGLTMSIERCGFRIVDAVPRFRIEGWNADGRVASYGPSNARLLLGPVQSLL